MFEITETIAVVAIICTATTVQTMFEAGNTEYHDCVFGEPELPPYRDGSGYFLRMATRQARGVDMENTKDAQQGLACNALFAECGP